MFQLELMKNYNIKIIIFIVQLDIPLLNCLLNTKSLSKLFFINKYKFFDNFINIKYIIYKKVNMKV